MINETTLQNENSAIPEKLKNKQKLARGVWLIVASILLTPVALFIGYLSIHPDGKWLPYTMIMFFPYETLLLFLLRDNDFAGPILIIMICAQYPFYGLFLAIGIWRDRFRKYKYILIIFHIIGILLFFFLVRKDS